MEKFENKLKNNLTPSSEKDIFKELAFAIIIAVLSYVYARSIHFREIFYLNEIAVALVIFVICLIWFIYRRIQDLQVEMSVRREIEKELMKSEEKFRQLTELLPVGVCETDMDFNITYANRQAFEMLQYTEDDLKTGLNCIELLAPEYRKKMQEIAKRRSHGEQFDVVDYKVTRKDGTVFPALLYITPILEDGVATGFRGVIVNIIDRKRVENDLKKTIKELARSNKELEQFAYVASHDLRAPARKIASLSDLLRESLKDKLNEDEEENLNFVIDNSIKMITLIQDLLTYSRITTRAEPFKEADLKAIIENILEDLEISIKETNASIQLPESLPTVTVDRAQVQRVFTNLLENALTYRREGVAPEITVTATEYDHRFVMIEIADNGIGVDVERKDDAFKMFTRLTPNLQYEGTGIGLAVCKKVVERHGGSIGIKANPGSDSGSIFWFTLPK